MEINDIKINGFDKKECIYNIELNGKKEKVTAVTIESFIAGNIRTVIDKSLSDTDLYCYGYIEDILDNVKNRYKHKVYNQD